MFVLDMPDAPPQVSTIIVAQSNQVGQTANAMRTAGICHVMQNPPDAEISGQNILSFAGAAVSYLWEFEKLNLRESEFSAKVTLLVSPDHGKLVDEGKGSYAYVPNPNYYGKDKAVALVDIGGYHVKVIYFLQSVQENIGDDSWEEIYCGSKGAFWKISQSTTPVDVFDIQSMMNFIGISGAVTVTTPNLANGGLGQTTGQSITLDNNTAGHNWYVDLTPGLNQEFLPTSNPYEWIAKQA